MNPVLTSEFAITRAFGCLVSWKGALRDVVLL